MMTFYEMIKLMEALPTGARPSATVAPTNGPSWGGQSQAATSNMQQQPSAMTKAVATTKAAARPEMAAANKMSIIATGLQKSLQLMNAQNFEQIKQSMVQSLGQLTAVLKQAWQQAIKTEGREWEQPTHYTSCTEMMQKMAIKMQQALQDMTPQNFEVARAKMLQYLSTITTKFTQKAQSAIAANARADYLD